MLLHRGIPENRFLPICSLTKQRRIKELHAIVSGISFPGNIVAKSRELPQVHHIQSDGLVLYGSYPFVAKLRFACSSTICRYQHHPIRTLCSINRRCRGVLQHFYRNNICAIEGGQGRDGRHASISKCIPQTKRCATSPTSLHDHSVDYVKRLGISVDRCLPPYPDRHCASRRARSHGCCDA